MTPSRLQAVTLILEIIVVLSSKWQKTHATDPWFDADHAEAHWLNLATYITNDMVCNYVVTLPMHYIKPMNLLMSLSSWPSKGVVV